MGVSSSNFNLYFHTAGELEFHEGLYGLVVAVVDVDKTLVARQFELLTCFLVYEGRAVNRENTFVRRQWNRTTSDLSTKLWSKDFSLIRIF